MKKSGLAVYVCGEVEGELLMNMATDTLKQNFFFHTSTKGFKMKGRLLLTPSLDSVIVVKEHHHHKGGVFHFQPPKKDVCGWGEILPYL